MDSVGKTGRLVAADECYPAASVASEVAGIFADQGFGLLKKPAKRLNCPAVPGPASQPLEASLIPTVEKIVAAAKALTDQLVEEYRAAERRHKAGGTGNPAMPGSPLSLSIDSHSAAMSRADCRWYNGNAPVRAAYSYERGRNAEGALTLQGKDAECTFGVAR